MNYKDYIGFTKTFVVVHYTGFGVMEAPYQEQEVVYETDNLDDAYAKANEFKALNNTPESIESSWCSNAYHVNVNTLNENGKLFLKEFEEMFENKLKNIQEHPNYHKTVMPDGSVWHQIIDPNDPLYEKGTSKKPLSSHSLHIFDTRIEWSEFKKSENEKD